MTCVQRLAGRRRLEAVRSGGSAGRGRLVLVRALRNGGDVSRAGIAVRATRSAVERNRARRRIRAALRDVLCSHQGIDLLVAADAARAARAPFWQLREDLAAAVQAAARHISGGAA
jgi:ribonuclease P protein component